MRERRACPARAALLTVNYRGFNTGYRVSTPKVLVTPRLPDVRDSVEKVLSCEESIFSGGAGALMEKLSEGPHVHADFQPARFVARLQGILLPNTGRDAHSARRIAKEGGSHS